MIDDRGPGRCGSPSPPGRRSRGTRRYSKPGCPQETDWALPGWYHLAAAAFDGEPTDTQFRLALPTAATITASPQGGDKPGDGSTKKPGGTSTEKPGRQALGRGGAERALTAAAGAGAGGRAAQT